MTPELSVVLPCYNEAGNVPGLLARFRPLAVQAALELILVDNGSTDATPEALRAALAEPGNAFARSVRVPVNAGYGHGIQTGLETARAATVAFSHADLQCPPEDVLRAYEVHRRESASGPCLVKGRRLGRAVLDRAVTRAYNGLAAAALGLRATRLEDGRSVVPDLNAQPKVFDRALVAALAEAPKDFTYDLYVLHLCARRGVRVLEFDVPYLERGWGKSKLAANPWVRLKTAANAARRVAELRQRRTS